MAVGHDHLVYWDSADNWATPTWDLIGASISESVTTERTDIPLPQKGNSFLRHAAGQIDLTMSITMQYAATDADRAGLESAIQNNTEIIMAFSDGPIADSGTEYLKAECVVISHEWSRGTDEAVELSLELKVADTDNDPTWTTTS